MPKAIEKFDKEYRFLSNFYATPILYQDILYPTVAHVFQAMKTKDKDLRFEISILETPGKAKKAGRSLKLRKDWEDIKDSVMRKFVMQKFKIGALRTKLLETGNAKLVEGNWWGDTYWGVCNGEGKNKLGKILMQVRQHYVDLSN